MDIFVRSKSNPILKPVPEHDWESFKVYNCAAVYDSGEFHLFYRAMNRGENWRSSIGYAVSPDGEHFERFLEPVLSAETDAEKRGLEDPRVTKIGDTFFMSYAAYDGNDVRLNIATSTNLIDWTKRGQVFSGFRFLDYGGARVNCREGKCISRNEKVVGKEWSKSGAIFPEKINGKFWMLFGEYRIWAATSDDGLHWSVLPDAVLAPREDNYFDNAFVEMGPPPIKTSKGWLVIYHGINKWKTYRLGFMLVDLHNPREIVYRSSVPIFEPQEEYELRGYVDVLPGGLNEIQRMDDTALRRFIDESVKRKQMPAVVFCCGAVVVDDLLRIYYGASDSYVCTATASITDILKLAR